MTQELIWNPGVKLTSEEETIIKRGCKNRKLFEYLRRYRHEIFDTSFQEELSEMYRMTGAGRPPHPPALMAMATLLQKYTGVSDNEVEALIFSDKRWQMVLGLLGTQEAEFGQSTFFDFRQRMLASNMDKRMLERTVKLAQEVGGPKPKEVKLGLDSSPLKGVGKVEDTINLLAHAARKTLSCIAQLTNHTVEEMAQQMDVELLTGSSIKASLDINWNKEEEKKKALDRLYCEIEHLESWLQEKFPNECEKGVLKESLTLLDKLIMQDLEPDPEGGIVRIIEGVAPDRQISISDPEMRHGRKSSSKRFDGFKNHIARDMEQNIILAAVTTKGNEPDGDVAEELMSDALKEGQTLSSLLVDRVYLHSPKVIDFAKACGKLQCRPPKNGNRGGLFGKDQFRLDLVEMTASCPAGQSIEIELGKTVEFPATGCDLCALRAQCTTRPQGVGRSLHIHENETLFEELREMQDDSEGRKKLRERVDVEHGLSHVVHRQGDTARYRGVRKNTFDLRMVCSIQNLERIQYVESKKLQMAA